MDYQASTRCKIILKSVLLKACYVIGISFLFSSTVFAQATNPLTTDITISAFVPLTPSNNPNQYPDTKPIPPPGPVNMTDTNDVALFKGYAYPGSVVSLLKNGTIIAETPANPDGSFELRLRNVGQGTFSFGLRAEDIERLKSKLLLFTIYVSSNAMTVIDGIIIPPTITSDKVEVKKNEEVTFTGRSVPNAEIRISLSSPFDAETIKKAKADESGYWKYALSTSLLKFGDYDVKAMSVNKDSLSAYSDIINVRVGNTSRMRAKASELAGYRRKCDLNDDSRVNILDFSIMAFWYKRLGFPPKVDMDTDGKINLTDLSILAYCWTG